MVAAVSPRALVVLRVPRGAPRPPEPDIQNAIRDDRRRLSLPPVDGIAYRVAGPYPIEVGGQVLDEYVAWEI
jgi:hypothetical protein